MRTPTASPPSSRRGRAGRERPRHVWLPPRTLALCAATALLLAGCLPLPTVRPGAPLPRPDRAFPLADVRLDVLTFDGYDDGDTPDAYERATVLRYRPPRTAAPRAPQGVLILSPGIFSGAASFDHLARQTVAALPDLEVWAVDRRANGLEDRSAMIAALEEGDPAIAYEYYVTRAGTDEGFTLLDPERHGFMRGWGLDVHLGDLHQVVLAARERAERVLLAGYSLSGALAGYYAAYLVDHERGGTRTGQSYLDGLILLDGVLGRTGGFGETSGVAIGPFQILPDAAALQRGEGRPWVRVGQYGPSELARRGTFNLMAHLDPHGRAPPEAVDFEATNEAALGLRYSTRYGLSTAFGATLGEPVDAVTAGNLAAFVISGPQGASSRSVVGPAGESPVRWERGDAPVSVAAIARSWAHSASDGYEWYFPSRLAVDVVAGDVALRDDQRFVPNAQVTLPTLIIGAGRGLVQSERQLAAYRAERLGYDLTAAIIPEYTHLDVLWADDNPVVALIDRWLTSRFGERETAVGSARASW